LGQGGSVVFRSEDKVIWDKTKSQNLSDVVVHYGITAKYVCVDEIEGWKGKIGESAEIFVSIAYA
jgi:hypothetical protein